VDVKYPSQIGFFECGVADVAVLKCGFLHSYKSVVCVKVLEYADSRVLVWSELADSTLCYVHEDVLFISGCAVFDSVVYEVVAFPVVWDFFEFVCVDTNYEVALSVEGAADVCSIVSRVIEWLTLEEGGEYVCFLRAVSSAFCLEECPCGVANVTSSSLIV